MGENGSTDVVTNTKWFIFVNVLQKIVTFALNQIMIATTSPEVLGQAAIQLELLLSTLLFLSREGIRLTTLRHKIISKDEFQAVINLSWIPSIAITVFIVLITIFRHRLFPNYNFTVIYMYAFAALIECIGEPCYNIFQNTGNIKPRLSAETSAVFAKSVVTVFCVANLNLGVNGFGLAQVSYGIIYLLVLLSHWISAKHSIECNQTVNELRLWDILPKPLITSTSGIFHYLFSSNLVSTALTLTGSSLLKHILTESDKIALTLTSNTYNQGIYAVTNNYGSLAARMIYLPLEDSSRLAFSKLAYEFRDTIKKSNHSKNLSKECSLQYMELKNTFIYLIRLVSFIGIFFIIFGIPYISIFIKYILSKQWCNIETINALSIYCIYLFVMGINGISESFVQSTAPSSAFMSLNMGLILSSMGFILIAIIAVPRLGTSGIILANIISMCIRIINNSYYIMKMFKQPEIFLHINNSKDNQILKSNLLTSLVIQPRDCLLWFLPPTIWIFNTILCTLLVHISLYYYQLSVISDNISHYAACIHILIGGIVAIVFLVVTIIYAPIEISQSIWNKLPATLQSLLSKQQQRKME